MRALTGVRTFARAIMRRALWPAIAGLACLGANPCLAQNSASPGTDLSGRVSLGIRSVSVDGTVDKFREDINLDDGVRLVDASLRYTPDPGINPLVDRVAFDAANLGGDPFESLHLDAQKFGAYSVRLDRRRSEYFYDDVILPPELASVTGSTGGDHHSFDFERVRDTAAVDIVVTPATRLNFDLERYTRSGDSTTTLDVARDEFELDRPIDESLEAFGAGVEHRWDRITLAFEQRFRQFDNTSALVLPGASAGENTGDLTELLFFSADQSYDYSSRDRLLSLTARPTERLDVVAMWRHEDLDLDLEAAQTSQGTDFAGDPFAELLNGSGSIARSTDLHALDMGYALSPRIRLSGSVRRSQLDQAGRAVFADEGAGAWSIETFGAEAGVELAVTDAIAIGAGISREDRDADFLRSFAGDSLQRLGNTGRDGYFLRLNARLRSGLSLTISAEDNDIDDAYTLASPTGSRRYRVRIRQRWNNGLGLTASLRSTRLENRSSAWRGDTDQTDLRLTYAHDRLQLGLGVGSIELERAIVQLVTGGTRQDLFPIDFTADVASTDVSIRWQLRDRIAIGGRFYGYDNDGSFALEREDSRISVDYDLNEQYALAFIYRRVEFSEASFDAYDADLIEVALSLRW